MIQAALHVRADAPIGTISPRLYGHFAEHLGRCCYDGLWTGRESPYEHDDGLRVDVVKALKALPVPLLRWPGGCYADHYHWRDGIGAPESRPRRLGTSCGLRVAEDNGFGTHEFLKLCAMIGAEPYLAGNVGTGTPQELCDWVEYCNATWDTDLVHERTANGSPAPFDVKLWGVGNESWGCGGNYDAEDYGKEYRRYATMMQHVDPTLELVLGGTGFMGEAGEAWNIGVLKPMLRLPGLIDHLSIHHYWTHGGSETAFSEDKYYDLLAEAETTEAFVARTAEILTEYFPNKKIGVALDEWGVWHPEAREWGNEQQRGGEARKPVTYEQANTLRDALAVGVCFEGFHRQCNVLSMANLAQIVNVLQSVIMTDGESMYLTPTYHAFSLHTPHFGAAALPVETEAGVSMSNGAPMVSATASRGANGIAVTVINRSYSDSASVRVGGVGGSFFNGRLLTADDTRAENSGSAPERVTTVGIKAAADGANWVIELPAHSMATVEFR